MARKKNQDDVTGGYLGLPPDWRWQRALKLVAAKKNASRKREDQATCDATRFLRAFNRYCSTDGIRKLNDRDKETMAALRIYQFGGPQKLELQCRLLARQSVRAISRLMKLPMAVITLYAELFFDVADRLGAHAYIVLSLIGMPAYGPPTQETLMMMSAYHHGPHAVEAWLDYLQHAGEVHDLTTVEGRTRESIELLIAIHQLPPDESVNCSYLGPLAAAFGYREKQDLPCSVADTLRKVCDGILDVLPWERFTVEQENTSEPSVEAVLSPSLPLSTQSA